MCSCLASISYNLQCQSPFVIPVCAIIKITSMLLCGFLSLSQPKRPRKNLSQKPRSDIPRNIDTLHKSKTTTSRHRSGMFSDNVSCSGKFTNKDFHRKPPIKTPSLGSQTGKKKLNPKNRRYYQSEMPVLNEVHDNLL